MHYDDASPTAIAKTYPRYQGLKATRGNQEESGILGIRGSLRSEPFREDREMVRGRLLELRLQDLDTYTLHCLIGLHL